MSTWINDDVVIDFPVPKSLAFLIQKLEELDAAESYAYFNYGEALDDAAKELHVRGKITRAQWDLLCQKYGGLNDERGER